MKIEVKPRTAATFDAKVLKLHLKVTDRFTASLLDSNGHEIHEQDDGYVPDFMPGDHFFDYVILDIDVDTGKILNWKCDPEKLAEWVEGDGE